ncbi:MAG: hypothetical protein WC341_13825 [Bacteroidales bacterium]|jgi:hypothetical protein
MDRAKIRLIRAAVEAALKPFAEKNKLVITLPGNSTFSHNSVHFKIEVTEMGKNGETPGQQDFNTYCGLYGLKPEDFGQVFTSGTRQFKLVEICPNRPKYPLVGEDIVTGKRFKFVASTAQLIRPASTPAEY